MIDKSFPIHIIVVVYLYGLQRIAIEVSTSVVAITLTRSTCAESELLMYRYGTLQQCESK